MLGDGVMYVDHMYLGQVHHFATLRVDIYSAQQAESLWYHVLYSISCKTEASTDITLFITHLFLKIPCPQELKREH